MNTPDKLLVFSSISDDSIGLTIYRQLFETENFDTILLEDDDPQIDNPEEIFPINEDSNPIIDQSDLDYLLDNTENIEQIESNLLGIFNDLGFGFTDDMIEEIMSSIDDSVDKTVLHEVLQDLEYIDKNWNLIDWDKSLPILEENLTFILEQDPKKELILQTIVECTQTHALFYPGIFEVLLNAASLFEKENVYLQTKKTVICIKTTANSPLPQLFYPVDEFDIDQLTELNSDNTEVVILDARKMNEFYQYFRGPSTDGDITE